MIPEIIRKIRTFSDTLPALTLLAGILNGALGILLFGPGLPAGYLALAALPGLLFFWALLGTKRAALRFAPAACAALFSAAMIADSYRQSFPAQQMRFQDSLGAEIEVRLTEQSLCGGSSCAGANAPRLISAQLEAFRFSGEDEWKTASGNLFLKVQEGAADRFGYGDRVMAAGRFERIPEEHAPGSFNFASYAAVRQIELVFYAAESRKIAQGTGLRRRLFDLRTEFLEKLTARMKLPEDKAVAAALFFGLKQGIEREIRQSFLLSGTIHIMCVSGLHTGLFFVVLALLFRWVPFRRRAFIILPLVLIYVLSTGMQAPAMRAFIMLAVWEIFRAMLCQTPPLNTILTAAVLILCIRPFELFSLGFQYSFLCVIFLAAGDRFVRSAAAAVRAKTLFRPEFQHKKRMAPALTRSAGTSVTAWLCGMELSLYSQGIFTPFAAIAYLPMAPTAWLAFLIFTVALLCSWSASLVGWLGALLVPLIHFLYDCAGFFAQTHLILPPPPLGLVLLFPIVFAVILTTRHEKVLRIGVTLLLLLLTLSLCWKFFLPTETVLVLNGDYAPAIVYSDPASDTAYVINGGGYSGSREIRKYLHGRGHTKLRELVFAAPYLESCSGGDVLALEFSPEAIRIPGKNLRSQMVRDLAKNPAAKGTGSRIRIENLPENRIRITPEDVLWHGQTVEYAPRTSGGWEILFQDEKFIVPPSSGVRIKKTAGSFEPAAGW